VKDLQDKNSPRDDASLDQRQMGLRILARMIARSVLNVENPVANDEDKSQKEQSNDSREC